MTQAAAAMWSTAALDGAAPRLAFELADMDVQDNDNGSFGQRYRTNGGSSSSLGHDHAFPPPFDFTHQPDKDLKDPFTLDDLAAQQTQTAAAQQYTVPSHGDIPFAAFDDMTSLYSSPPAFNPQFSSLPMQMPPSYPHYQSPPSYPNSYNNSIAPSPLGTPASLSFNPLFASPNNSALGLNAFPSHSPPAGANGFSGSPSSQYNGMAGAQYQNGGSINGAFGAVNGLPAMAGMNGMSARTISGIAPFGGQQAMGPHIPSLNGALPTDLQSFIRPYLDQYTRTTNRLAFGERTVIVMSSKVAQKSYGTEKRFLCPPPTAIMIGNSWWSEVGRSGSPGDGSGPGGMKQAPPRVVISISGEPVPQEGSVEWTSTSGKSFDVNDPPPNTTYIGRCVGKQLFISDVDEKKKKVEALVKIMAPAGFDEGQGGAGGAGGMNERVIGVFPSRPIKVISKPSKKRQSAKNLELCINHGSTISLFHRLRSQTVSTKYLCVSGSGSSFKGSDGAPLMGVDARTRSATPSFIARTASWDPFVLYIVDVNKPSGGIDAPPPPPPQPDYPSPPPNAIPFTNNGSQIPVYYNQTVVLQCLTSGVVSPVLVIRKVDHGTTVVGGGLAEGAKGVAEHFCAPGEVCGDPVSQLHKIAFEVYDGNNASRVGMDDGPGVSGAFLSCMGEKVNTYRPVDGRQWNVPPPSHQQASSRGSDSPPPGSPTNSSAAPDYFGSSINGNGSPPASPTTPYDFPTNDGGRVKRGKRSTSSAGGGNAVGMGVVKTSSAKGRRRQNSAGSTTSSRHGASGSNVANANGNEQYASSGALWSVDIGETSVWTIVGTDQVRYNFYVPPVLFDALSGSPMNSANGGMGMGGFGGGMGGYPIPLKPVTPFPGVVKYLPPDRAAEAPKANCPQSKNGTSTPNKPHPHASKMLTLYGENFSKVDPVTVFFGSDPSPYVEVRCTEVVGCLPPETGNNSGKRRPIVLVRSDGVVFPSSTMYP